eukprot:gnl/TRDRNA2_/TRDRNA2_180738_c0_seq1.p1 gnl/TRDRNA2_/TRDRNA2_180738_c0~~gnl/TRDRNA2_/TRDRNA2_180738_c0_seq1.p1  ORF type:complete len:211 (+),score=74.93 gnl/TRDRNA2_/TRDRNA2_180738_c0_seq1:147-779(+)
MNFVKSETLVQEITADGKVRDIISAVPDKRTEAQREADRKEDILRNLPEFKRMRHGGADDSAKSVTEQMADNKAAAEEEEKEKKKLAFATLDEEECEHLQEIEQAEIDKRRRDKQEVSDALDEFARERKRFKESGGEDTMPNGLAQQLAAQKEAAKKAAEAAKRPTAAERMRGRVVVKPKAAEAAPPEVSTAGGGGGGGGLVGYGSDSDD